MDRKHICLCLLLIYHPFKIKIILSYLEMVEVKSTDLSVFEEIDIFLISD